LWRLLSWLAGIYGSRGIIRFSRIYNKLLEIGRWVSFLILLYLSIE
jgi:hypothetical protein